MSERLLAYFNERFLIFFSTFLMFRWKVSRKASARQLSTYFSRMFLAFYCAMGLMNNFPLRSSFYIWRMFLIEVLEGKVLLKTWSTRLELFLKYSAFKLNFWFSFICFSWIWKFQCFFRVVQKPAYIPIKK